MCEDLDKATDMFTKKLTKVLDERYNYLPWMSEATKNNIKLRNEMLRKSKETQLDKDWKEYKKLRNSINNTIKTEKKLWQENKLISFGKDSKSIWKNVKNWLGWKTNGSPSKLMDEKGIIHSKPEKIANIQNDFYINKVKKLLDKLPKLNGDPLKLVRKIMKNRYCKFELQPVGPEVVTTIIQNMKTSSSCGLDNISSYVPNRMENLKSNSITQKG